MPVTVEMTGFRRYGVTLGRTPPASGRIVALGPAGVTVRFDAVLAGLDTVTVEGDRVKSAPVYIRRSL
jgi:hypothetical protein